MKHINVNDAVTIITGNRLFLRKVIYNIYKGYVIFQYDKWCDKYPLKTNFSSFVIFCVAR